MPFDWRTAACASWGELRSPRRAPKPQLVRALKTIGFDRFYVRGEGCYLYDAEGDRYLDLLSGSVSTPSAAATRPEGGAPPAIDLDLPNMSRWTAPAAGLLAEQLVAGARTTSTASFLQLGCRDIEAAIKFSRQATGGHGSSSRACLPRPQHGRPRPQWRRGVPPGFGKLLPGCEAVPFADIEALRRELKSGT